MKASMSTWMKIENTILIGEIDIDIILVKSYIKIFKFLLKSFWKKYQK